MNYQHKDLAAGRWQQLSLIEQMANIGSEVERFINWRVKKNEVYCQKSFERALELLDLSIDNFTKAFHLKELVRVREALVDFYLEAGHFKATAESWKKYFSHFTFAVRKNH
jgi:hypothetical protein